jgi:vacuolar-type H+-ATPase subunit H
MAVSDVTVFGLVAGIHFITDLGVGVPHGHTVTIPADKANKSKDLWRAIGQKYICLIQSGPYVQRNVIIPPGSTEPVAAAPDPSLAARQQALEEENKRLREALEKQRQDALAAEQRATVKLDTILELLRTQGPSTTTIVQVQGNGGPLVRAAVPEDNTPTFIPATIRPENTESRIEAKKTESDSTLSGASDKLRELRRKAKP